MRRREGERRVQARQRALAPRHDACRVADDDGTPASKRPANYRKRKAGGHSRASQDSANWTAKRYGERRQEKRAALRQADDYGE